MLVMNSLLATLRDVTVLVGPVSVYYDEITIWLCNLSQCGSTDNCLSRQSPSCTLHGGVAVLVGPVSVYYDLMRWQVGWAACISVWQYGQFSADSPRDAV